MRQSPDSTASELTEYANNRIKEVEELKTKIAMEEEHYNALMDEVDESKKRSEALYLSLRSANIDMEDAKAEAAFAQGRK